MILCFDDDISIIITPPSILSMIPCNLFCVSCFSLSNEFSILKFSDKPDIQEGYSYLLKGIVSNYRNPTHHSLSYECTRECALKICSYIDELLKVIESSEKIK